MPGVVDPDTTLRSGKPEVRLEIDRARAADLGVSVIDIEGALNTLIAGQVASTFNAGDDQYDVRVRAPENFRTSERGLSRLTVPSTEARRPSVSTRWCACIPRPGPSSVNRINRQRQVTLTCNIAARRIAGCGSGELDKAVTDLHMDPDYRSGSRGASKELGRTGYYFMLAFSLTFIFMYIVLAAQFESFIHPITILLTLPLAIPFGILSLLVFRPDRQHLLRPRPAAAVRHRQEECDSADRSHERPAARTGCRATTRSSRPTAIVCARF